MNFIESVLVDIMRILVISDIHANLDALQTVLKDAGEIDHGVVSG